MKKRIVIITSILSLLAVTVATGLSAQKISAQGNLNTRSVSEVIGTVGAFVKSNHDKLISGMDLTAKIPDEKVVCWVNGLPISNDELQFRYGLHTASGLGPQDLNEVKNILIREKVIEKEVADLGITPTTDEINQYIANEKEQMKNNQEFKDAVETTINAWGITEEEYWNVYERNNVFRILAADKLSRYVMPEMYNKDVIALDDQKAAKDKWNLFINDKVSTAEVKENPLLHP